MQYLDVISHHNFCLTEKRHENELPILKCHYFRDQIQKLMLQVEDIRGRLSTMPTQQSLQEIRVAHNKHAKLISKTVEYFSHAFHLSIKGKYISYIKERVSLNTLQYELGKLISASIHEVGNMVGLNVPEADTSAIESDQKTSEDFVKNIKNMKAEGKSEKEIYKSYLEMEYGNDS